MNLYLTDHKGLLLWTVRSVYFKKTDLETYSALSVFIELSHAHIFVFLNFQLYRCFDLYR